MEYDFRTIEQKWQQYWKKHHTFRTGNDFSRPKYYILDMFPYPSGAGLHVGHPLGYIASDIIARYRRLGGFNVLHPMGYDAFGLPAEQYAIQTGQHPAVTTENNIATYRKQLDRIGFSFDWEREVRTCDKSYYRWTQWIFLQLFNSWYNPLSDKAEPINNLIQQLEKGQQPPGVSFEGQWNLMSEKEKHAVLMNYRLAYLGEAMVNWCPALGTVLANEEVKDGVSERGGYPVERKLMPQWSLRITAYAERLLAGLAAIDWSESMKEAQRNWIGKSEGCSIRFNIKGSDETVEVFTTRPDTIFGVTFLALAPENELVEKIAASPRRELVSSYVSYAKNRTERERLSEVKKITGEFTGAYAIHPFTGKEIPVWTGEYVLSGYGTGAVMGVPAHDSRDYAFAKHFGLEIVQVINPATPVDISREAFEGKNGRCINSDFLNGLEVQDAVNRCIAEVEKRALGRHRVNYRLRDAVFGRQRYWGEPIPIYYKDGIPCPMQENELPLVLPEVDKYLPTESGEPPLARAATSWKYRGQYEYEKTTMPGWAGSSWYYLRYMDAGNDKELVSAETANYWRDVDLYIGGAEHATGHLLYVRFWTKFLYDLGLIPIQEPAKKLVNQGMIQGVSALTGSVGKTPRIESLHGKQLPLEAMKLPLVFVSENSVEKNEARFLKFYDEEVLKKYNDGYKHLTRGNDYEIIKGDMTIIYRHVPVGFVSRKDSLDIEKFREWRASWPGGEKIEIFTEEDGTFICRRETEKMSKSRFNVETPDDICENYGADTLRLYEMFLGPLEQSKPWSINGITGVHNFIRKLWKLFFTGEENTSVFYVSDEAPGSAELKLLHKAVKRIREDIERLSFNTAVSSFMICVNGLAELKCNKKSILEPLVILLSPFAPHISEELWERMGHDQSISFAGVPEYREEYLTEDSFEYPVSVNGKTRLKLSLSLGLSKEDIEKEVISSEAVRKYLGGAAPKKVIVVPGRIVNIVV